MNPRSMPQPDHNKRETGARKYPASKAQPAETDTHADMPSINPFGITQPSEETMEGAGPAIAKHSKDAKAPKGRRQPAAHMKH